MPDDDDDDDDRRARALVPVAAPPPPLRFASSIESAQAGELLAVDRRGRVLSRNRRAWVYARSWGILGTAVAANGVLYGTYFSPLAGVVASLASAGVVFFRMRHWPASRAARMLLAAQRWEEAHAALLTLAKRNLPTAQRIATHVNLAAIDQLLGRHQAALDRIDPLLAELGNATSVLRLQAVGVRALALAQLGRLDDARRERDRFTAPRQDYIELLYQSVTLAIAFAADDPDSLPDDDVLHDWARAALQRSRFGESLISLSWAFERRGDPEMARHLLAESASRITRPTLATAQPRLHAWAEARRATWAIGAEESDDDGAYGGADESAAKRAR